MDRLQADRLPGHCPYFLRTRDGIILLAHRLPTTSLHYSLDECQTWSQNVLVDTVGGAYPSMVNLKDGTVLIVYYEEGAGSSIRCKRFRATNRHRVAAAVRRPGPQPEQAGFAIRPGWFTKPSHKTLARCGRRRG